MYEFELILSDGEIEIPVTLHTLEDIDIVQAGFVAAEMFSAIESRFSWLC